LPQKFESFLDTVSTGKRAALALRDGKLEPLAEDGAGEDGLLEAWELMQLDLRAELAVLSAYETARGRVGARRGHDWIFLGHVHRWRAVDRGEPMEG
jgi:CHAT domain